ncbi:hypothetical protein N7474_000644 [Penicillium riverlandense]|uniref:uncharacterized protein n=1 Tax=Penicillium riverlandense TaxID=1903569 RepID=UPI002547A30F|nr:uncharacterized protein N7474_000644 [Penicillium riverlandense]KAJ5832333.1 hypothetical protein N7474_000644 [Penicillium riverlandense]
MLRRPPRTLTLAITSLSTRPQPQFLPRQLPLLVKAPPPLYWTAPPASSPPTSSAFSTRAALLTTKPRRSKSNEEKDDEIYEKPPSASLESLGISRNVKVFLFVVLGIFGTIETWFWCKAAWVWWKNRFGGGEETPERR